MRRWFMAWYKVLTYRLRLPKMPNIFGLRKEETVKVRTRDDNGHFIADDPNTIENEAWEEKPKPKGKKRGPYKKRAKKK